MRVTIDRAGRIVVPKRFRDALGLHDGAELDVALDGGGLRLDPVRAVENASDGLPRLRAVDGPSLTDDDAHDLRDEIRR